MKRIAPRKQYDTDHGYPSVADVDLHRRGFLGAALSGAAALGGALLLPDAAEAGRKHGRSKVVLAVAHRPSGCKYRVEKLVAQSYDKRFIKFLGRRKERPGVHAAVRAVLARAACADLTSLPKVSKLQKDLGKALAARYRKRTRRRTKAPAVTVVVRLVNQPTDVDGDVAMPSRPLLPIA